MKPINSFREMFQAIGKEPIYASGIAGLCAIIFLGMFTIITHRLNTFQAPPLSTPPRYKLADPNCKAYIAIPGEPCKEGLYLNVDLSTRRGTPPRDTLCSCAVIEIGSK